MLILREEDLAKDPGAALARIRSTTQGGEATRVLFVGPEPRAHVHDDVAAETPNRLVGRTSSHRRDARPPVAEVLVGALQVLANELGCELDALQAALDAGQPSETQSRSQTIAQMLAWFGAAHGDLDRQLDSGPVQSVEVPVAGLLGETARRLAADQDQVQFVHGLPDGSDRAIVMGSPVVLRVALRLAMELVVERIGGVGALHATAAVHGAEVRISLRGHGEAQALYGSARADCLRGLVRRLGGRIEPVLLDGPMPAPSTGMVICLPAAQGRGAR